MANAYTLGATLGLLPSIDGRVWMLREKKERPRMYSIEGEDNIQYVSVPASMIYDYFKNAWQVHSIQNTFLAEYHDGRLTVLDTPENRALLRGLVSQPSLLPYLV